MHRTQAVAFANQIYVNQVFANWVSQSRETKNRAYGLPREDHYTPDNVPNGVRWKNLLRRHLPSTAARRNLASGISFLDCSHYWSWRRDLNPRPSDYKSDALPAELRQPDHHNTLPGIPGNPRAHSGSAHNTAQFLRLAHRKQPSKPALDRP